MSIKRKIVAGLNNILNPIDITVSRKSEIDDLREFYGKARHHSFKKSPLPKGSSKYLNNNNEKLNELRKRYLKLNLPVTMKSIWEQKKLRREIDLRYFRGDNAYIFQKRDGNRAAQYFLTAYYIKSIDFLGMLDNLTEDDLFGIDIYNFNGKNTLSRDLLDSIIEMYFLIDTIKLHQMKNVKILDIGAGYGRFCHRAWFQFPKIATIFSTDAIAESTFLSEFYLNYRKVDRKNRVIPLDEVQCFLANHHIDLAINIHSFSECPVEANRWWLDRLQDNGTRYLMIVPNPSDHEGQRLLSMELDGTNIDYMPDLVSRGFELVVKRPKYRDLSVQREGVSPTYHYLFELKT